MAQQALRALARSLSLYGPKQRKGRRGPERGKPGKTCGVQKQKRVNRKNALLADGVRRFKKGKIAARKEHFSLKSLKMVRTKKPKVVKKISGAKNVGEYKVLRSAKRCFRDHKRYIHKTLKKVKKTCTEEELFAEKEVKYVPSEQRKADQKFLDEEVLKAIKAHPEDKVIRRYLKTMFSMPT
ncbi:conserved hypothetical protein [Culex quinquefasciatus]|uniref:60S ribosomal protein L6 n=2 Tax=Culex pipiens complex TaxID=518105 RepID=B0X5G2_CULQU|nr:conserved hypothetical protein [Culex quinquefasciatus]|eukprot:XP_001864884.1 conserved hypothetical protein [Culex quinquefasciatus]